MSSRTGWVPWDIRPTEPTRFGEGVRAAAELALAALPSVSVVAVAAPAVVEREGPVSLWCAWAAVTSVVIAAACGPGTGAGQPSVVVVLSSEPPSRGFSDRQRSLIATSSSRRSLPSSSSVAAV